VKRLIGAGSTIIFKGSGFYQTDYRSEEYKSRVEAEKPPAASDSKNKKTKKKKNAKD
jgi:predicted nucleic acid-binding Zn ribbon protein